MPTKVDRVLFRFCIPLTLVLVGGALVTFADRSFWYTQTSSFDVIVASVLVCGFVLSSAVVLFWRREAMRVLWEVAFYGIIVLGVWIIARTALSFWFALLVSFLVVQIVRSTSSLTVSHVVVRWILLWIGLVGGAVWLALRVSPMALVFLLVGLAVYDKLVPASGGLKAALASRLGNGVPFSFSVGAASTTGFRPYFASDMLVPLAIVSRAAFVSQVSGVAILCAYAMGVWCDVQEASEGSRLWSVIGVGGAFLLMMYLL